MFLSSNITLVLQSIYPPCTRYEYANKKFKVLKSIDYCFKWEFLRVVFSFCPKHYLSKSFVFPSHFRQNASTFQTKRPPPGHLLWAGILETCGLSAFLPESLWFLPELFWISFGQLLDFLIFFIFFVKIVLTFQTKRPLPLGHLPAWDKYTFGLSPGFTTFHFLWNLNLYQAIWSPVSFAGGASTGGYIFAKIYFCRIRILSILFIIHKASSLLQ